MVVFVDMALLDVKDVVARTMVLARLGFTLLTFVRSLAETTRVVVGPTDNDEDDKEC